AGVPGPPYPNAGESRGFGYSLLKSPPFSLVELRLSVDEQFLGRGAVGLRVVLQHKPHQLKGLLLREVVLLGVGLVPVALDTAEDHAIAGIEKHLGAAAGIGARGGLLQLLEHQPDVADSGPHSLQLPWP